MLSLLGHIIFVTIRRLQTVEEESAMQCPVCSRPAENLTPNTLDGVVVGCDHCGDYRVSGTAFYDLTRLGADQRATALQVAKSGSRAGWPTINDRCVVAR
jgi:hypothetical protein